MGIATLRETLIGKLDLAARVGAQIGIVSDQYRALIHGGPVVFTTTQLRSFQFTHPSLPTDLEDYTHWALEGENTLVGLP